MSSSSPILEYARRKAPRWLRLKCALAIASATVMTMLPLLHVWDVWSIPRPVLLAGEFTQPDSLTIAACGLVYIAARTGRDRTRWWQKCLAALICYPAILFCANWFYQRLWFNWFSLQQELQERLTGATLICPVMLVYLVFMALRGFARERNQQ